MLSPSLLFPALLSYFALFFSLLSPCSSSLLLSAPFCQCVESVRHAALFAASGLDADALYLLVHSGSRGLGAAVLDRHAAAHGTSGLTGVDWVDC